MIGLEFPPDEDQKRDNGSQGEPAHPFRAKPVGFLTLVQDDLHGGQPDGQEGEPDVVNGRVDISFDVEGLRPPIWP